MLPPSHVEYFASLKARLEAAEWKQRGPMLQSAAEFLKCSRDTIYRRLEATGWQSGRKTRSDRGKCCLDRETALRVGGMVHAATRANGKRTMSITLATDILEKNGMGTKIDKITGECTMPHPATVARVMKAHGCHPDQLDVAKPPAQMQSLHPNYVWEMDASVCILFYLPCGKAVTLLDETKYNAKKPGALAKLETMRVVRWVITDHYSGTIYVWYTQGTEDAQTAIEILIQAMCKREDGDLLHGAPLILYSDNGSAYSCALMLAFLDRLGIQGLRHKVKNAQATGQVECGQRIVEDDFEGRLRFLNITSLDELNRHAELWRLNYNANKIHSRHKHTRNAMWLRIAPDQLRVPASSDALYAIVGRPAEEVMVRKDLILRRDGRKYGLHTIEGIVPGGKILVSVNPFMAPAIDVTVTAADGAQTVYTVRPIEYNDAGFAVDAPVIGEEFKSLPDTVSDTARKDALKEAHGVSTLAEAEQRAKQQSRRQSGQQAGGKGHRLYEDINVMADIEAGREHTYLPRQGTALEPATPVQTAARVLQPLSPMQAMLAIKPLLEDAGRLWNRACMAWLEKEYPDQVPAEALENITAELTRMADPLPGWLPPRTAAGSDAGSDTDSTTASGITRLFRPVADKEQRQIAGGAA